MFAYVVRKLLNTIPTLLGVWIVIFVLFNVIGGDPTYIMLGKHATPELIADVRAEYGYDQPMLKQFFRYLGETVTFNWGDSRATRQPIATMIHDGLGPSLTLTVPAFLVTTVFSVLMGLLVAYFRGRWIDRIVVIGCVIGMSVPMLAFILFGQYFLAYKMGLFPIHGFDPAWPERFHHILLPALIWVVVSLGYNVRFYRTALVEEVGQDYIRTARAKGLGELPVFLKHVLKNGMVPILTNIVIEIPMLVLGSFLLESFFGIPGIGGITIAAINNSDFPVIRAMTTLVAMLFIAGNLATDILYTLVDPRVRLK
ncbi:MAG: peptide ABC transporter permease [Bdellovibrionales bacterium GWB1_55_8]|nr:MAG: peptide ABC transporter permease [Bdellovibrionales bacterium GWB1_55_8]